VIVTCCLHTYNILMRIYRVSGKKVSLLIELLKRYFFSRNPVLSTIGLWMTYGGLWVERKIYKLI